MDNIKKIKRLKNKVVRIFLLLLIPQIVVSLLTSLGTTNPMNNLKWQLCWFIIYFSISFLVYVFAPKIINKRNR